MPLPQPLERLSVPQGLNGRLGANRANQSHCQLTANNDLEAIHAWLAEFADSPQTLRHYQKEAERLLLWALLQRQKALSSLTREDCLAFQAFLANPTPHDDWCGPRAPRMSTRWRPFRGPLSATSQHTALLVINSLFSYLVKAGYLAGNPLALVRRRNRVDKPIDEPVERFLEQDQWQAFLETVEALPKATPRQQQHYERSRFLVALLYLLGPRVGEVASHTMGSFRQVRGRWWWFVTGKGRKQARVPVNGDMLNALQRYRRFLNLSPLPTPDDNTPLILSLKGTAAITANMIYRIIKTLAAQAADRLEQQDPQRAVHLRRASTHWFRHTSITHQAQHGIDLDLLRRSARHAKLDTTSRYLHTEEASWHAAMEQHRLTGFDSTD
jgi:site-specific recombinase XerD